MAEDRGGAVDAGAEPPGPVSRSHVWWQLVLDSVVRPWRTFAKGRNVPLWVAFVVAAAANGVSAAAERFAQLSAEPMPPAEALLQSLAFGAGFLLFTPLDLVFSAAVLHPLLWLMRAKKRSFTTTLAAVGMSRSVFLTALPLLFVWLALAKSNEELQAWVFGLGSILMSLWGMVALTAFVHVLHDLGKLRAAFAVLGPLLFSVGLALGLRTFALEAFKIPAGSMWPTLQIQDHVFVTKSGYEPRRGELIVFEYPRAPDDPGEPMDFVKRVLGLPGDRILVRDSKVLVNDRELRTCRVGNYHWQGTAFQLRVEFLDDQAYLVASDGAAPRGAWGPFKLGPNELFVMGDNRDNSHDSRAWMHGPGVPLENVKGRVWIVWLSFADGDRNIDFSRIGMNLHEGPRLPSGAPHELEANLQKCLEGWTPRD